MIQVDEKEKIRRLYFIKRHSIRQIAREHRYSRKTVRKAINDASVPEYHLSVPKPYPVMGPYLPIIERWLKEDKFRPKKQRHTAHRIYDRLVAQRENTELRYVHQACPERRRRDHLTGTSLMTDTNGDSLGTIKYYPYGGARSGDVPTDKKFTGQRLDSTGLYYYGARYYDPEIGRFISADTVVPNPANPQSLNRYTYCFNNPLKYIDPTGHQPEIDNGNWFYIPGVGWVDIYSGLPVAELPVDNSVTDWDLNDDISLSIPRGFGGSWFILANSPNILITDNAIINRSIRITGGRIIHIHYDPEIGLHLNADTGPLARFNHAKLPGVFKHTKAITRTFIVVGIAVDAADLTTAFQADGWNFGTNAQEAVGRVGGGWGGALAGAAIGTAICPVWGTLIGGIVGAIGGSWIGGNIPGWFR